MKRVAWLLLTGIAIAIGFTAAAAPAKTNRVPPRKTTATKRVTPAKKKRTVQRASRTPKPPPVSPVVKAQATEQVNDSIVEAGLQPIENAGALVPFYEQLFRHTQDGADRPLSILQYGDSHTASDDWPGSLRLLFQQRFGDGGGGYSYAGRPWNSYRRYDVKSAGTKGWHSDGLAGRAGDGMYGLGGVSMSTSRAGESVTVVADCRVLEVFYLQQPGGGTLELLDNGASVDRISTDGPLAPAYARYVTDPGAHRFDLRTVKRAPVRLFGWVTENDKGITYETLGINGAQASMILNWDENVLASNIGRRNPALIVLAYGTNEAGNKDWTEESYREMFTSLVQRLRRMTPTASILVIGPPDRFYRVRNRGWAPYDNVDRIVAAQRAAALANGCAFWDLRAKMGGKGSMRQWVLAGLAQYDHVHFTGQGYRLLGSAVFRDLMSQYDVFMQVRALLIDGAASVVAGQANGQTNHDH